MPSFTTSEIITHLTAAQNLDNARPAGDRFKLSALLRADVDADLADLLAKEVAVAPSEGGRAGASGAQRAALDQLKREHQGGYRFISGLDEATITPAQRLQVFESYGWGSGEVGDFTDDRIISLARLAPTITAVEAGNALWLYPAARLGRIAAQLAIVDAMEGVASGGDRQTATLQRDTARDLAATTLLRVRFAYCAATRDADQTPELVKIGYQPRRDPGGAGGGGPAPAPEPPELPGAPQNVTVTTGEVGSGQVLVSCDPPPAEEEVTEFRVYSSEAQVVGTGATLPVTAGGFTPGTSVTLTLRTVNAAGEGPDSDPATGTAG